MRDEQRRNDIEIQTPCPRSWDSLVGDERKRFCAECSLHVHNSAALTRAEARELIEEASERVCMRVVRDASGAPIYLDSGGFLPGTGCGSAVDAGSEHFPRHAGPGPIRALPRAAGWILAAGAGLLSACRDETQAVVNPGTSGKGVDPGCTAPGGTIAPIDPGFELLGEVAMPTTPAQPHAPEMGAVAPPEELGDVALTREELGEVEVTPKEDALDEPPGEVPAHHEMMGRVAPQQREVPSSDGAQQGQAPDPDPGAGQ